MPSVFSGHIYKVVDHSITTVPMLDRSASLSNPTVGPSIDAAGIAVDSTGNLFVADYQNCRIVRVEQRTNDFSTIAGTGQCKTSGDGTSAKLASFDHPTAVAVDLGGNVYFASNDTQACVRRIDGATGVIRSIPGTCEVKPGTHGPPSGLAVDSRGDLYFTLWASNLVRRIDTKTGFVTTIAWNGLPDRRD
jgi:streptogramin lyase